MMACLSYDRRGFVGPKKDGDSGPLGIQSSLGLSLEINQKKRFRVPFQPPQAIPKSSLCHQTATVLCSI